jgi:ankyrin repeat protein
MKHAWFIAASYSLLLLSGCRDERTLAQRALREKNIPLHAEQVHHAVKSGDETSLQQLLLCGVYPNQCADDGSTPLQAACQRSDFRMVRLLLQHGAAPNADNGPSPLATAAFNGDIAIAEDLLKHGANPNVRSIDAKPLLLSCIEHGRYVIADSMLTHGADLHAVDRFGNNALAHAIHFGRRPLTEHMLALGADPGRATRAEGAFTPNLIRCVELGWHDLLPTLVKRGAELNATGSDGQTILCRAIASQSSEQIRAILDLYPDPDAKLADGRTLLECSLACDESVSLYLLQKGATATTEPCILSAAIRQKKRKLTDALLARKFGISKNNADVFARAMEHGWHDLLEPLAHAGADVNALDKHGKSAAVHALENGHTEAFHQLIRLEARPPKSSWADSIADAIKQEKPTKLRTLLKAGIRPHEDANSLLSLFSAAMRHKDISCLNSLLAHEIRHPMLFHIACQHGRADVLPLLEKYGVFYDASLNAIHDHPMHIAIHRDRIDILRYLLAQGRDIHALGLANQTPLVCAIAHHRLEMVKLLLQNGADPNRPLEPKANETFLSLFSGNGMRWYLTFDRNLTPLMIAADSGRVDIADTLMKNGAKLGAWTTVNKTWPLNFACRKADVPMMRLLLRKAPYIETQHIHVSLARQEAQLIDACGNVVFTTKISTGKKGFATPTGTYVITNKYREWRSTIYDGASMPCFQRLSCGDFGFHQGYVPGYPASHGCLRVPYGNAQKLFALTQVGDRVVIE